MCCILNKDILKICSKWISEYMRTWRSINLLIYHGGLCIIYIGKRISYKIYLSIKVKPYYKKIKKNESCVVVFFAEIKHIILSNGSREAIQLTNLLYDLRGDKIKFMLIKCNNINKWRCYKIMSIMPKLNTYMLTLTTSENN